MFLQWLLVVDALGEPTKLGGGQPHVPGPAALQVILGGCLQGWRSPMKLLGAVRVERRRCPPGLSPC